VPAIRAFPAHAPLFATTRGVADRRAAGASAADADPLIGRDTAECLHYGSIAIVDRHGALLAQVGDGNGVNFTRSTLKPLQALPFVEDGGLARYGFGSQELALMCASHNGETVHTALARTMLDRVGARVGDLQCGAHPPRYFEAAGVRSPDDLAVGPLHHNCSGKHSGFLAYCCLHQHRLSSYLDPDAPLQVRVRNTVQRFAPGETLVAGTDGCSAPNFAVPLRRLAQIYCRIAVDDDAVLRALYYAMTRHPDLVSGTARTDLALMQAGGGDWVCKIGAEGMQAVGVRAQGLGIAVRIASGDARALHVATVEVLHQIGLLDDPLRSPLARHFRPAAHNARGTETGRYRPLFKLPRLVS
jgi:L-asparaginase II